MDKQEQSVSNKEEQSTTTTTEEKPVEVVAAPSEQQEFEPIPLRDENANLAIPAPQQPVKIKHEWYQTESGVTVCILAKNLSESDVKIDAQDHTLSIVSTDPEKQPQLNFNFNLSHAISAKDTAVKFMSSKIEIKLRKQEATHWSMLELTAEQLAAKKAQEAKKPAYPSSSKNPRNWDKIVADVVAEERDEKLEGEAATNKFFQQIYADGNDEIRRAMNKSFYESGGTVLSTNWKEVGSKKVDVNPPDCMEYKKWNS